MTESILGPHGEAFNAAKHQGRPSPWTCLTYRVGVHYFNEHEFGTSFATLRFYAFGQPLTELGQVELHKGATWDAATLHWPSATVTPLVGQDGQQRITPDYPLPDYLAVRPAP